MVDGQVYKTYTINCHSAITPEPAPTKEGYTFSGWSEIPETMPDHDVIITGTFEQNSLKCATPVIAVVGGKLKYTCETEGVKFKSSVTFQSSNKELEDDEVLLSGTSICHISVYATKEGYEDSEVVTKDMRLNVGVKGDVNNDGTVSPADAIEAFYIFFGTGQNHAPQIIQPTLEPQ